MHGDTGAVDLLAIHEEFKILGDGETCLVCAELCHDAAEGGDACGDYARVHPHLGKDPGCGIEPCLVGERLEVARQVNELDDGDRRYASRDQRLVLEKKMSMTSTTVTWAPWLSPVTVTKAGIESAMDWWE